jgi:hypothetical protein
MNKLHPRVVLGILALVATVPTAFARGAATPPVPDIEHVEVDAAQSQLTLQGRYFKADHTVVMLGRQKLEIAAVSPTQVVARLPVGIRPATYRLLIGTSPAFVNARTMYVQIPLNTASVQVAVDNSNR